ncbi:M56 family metallopeptidase [Parabacteroides sp. AM08-6]|uniref:M56 family metallopeptidase n=1 Tax=Parabacteroides sp. AM08-6 TaxID=2292053 RepID=UPI000EFDC2A9|nr:M56 family metallopeptidase [Parabacteroides sp. AM08-6]RHJ83471.1 TonB family protein [Parabacteroides sp. AM08-6]
MENSIFLYFIKINLAIALLYICYRLLFQHDTFFRLRRFTLLFIYFAAFFYQLPDLSSWLSNHSGVTEMVSYYSNFIPKETIVTTEDTITQSGWQDALFSCLQWGYIAGVIVLFLRCIFELSNVVCTYYTCKKTHINGIRVCLLPKAEAAYSFFGWIFIYPKQYSRTDLNEILLHEQTHVRLKHTLDLVVSEIISIICWINPCAWLIKKEISINQEYQADQEVLYAGYNKKRYQYLLIGLGHSNKAIAKLYNNFSVLPLKKRISMLNKKRTNSVVRIKYLALLPLVGGLLLINNIDTMAHLVTEQMTETEPVSTAEIHKPVTLPEETTAPLPPDNETKYTICDVMPKYPGSKEELIDFINKNIKYPEEALKKRISGRVSVSFLVNKDGSLSDFVVRRSASPLLDAEAIRVAKLMPKWIPGKLKDKTVTCYYTIPISFKLPKK